MIDALPAYSVALQRFEDTLNCLEQETIAWRHAFGRVLAEDVTARFDFPAYNQASFEGYAVKASDLVGATPQAPKTLTCITSREQIPNPNHPELPQNSALKVEAGAPIPEGANAVVRLQQCQLVDDQVQINLAPQPMKNIRRRAEEIRAGMVILQAGETIDSAHLGLLLSQGIEEVAAYQRPKVAIISRGHDAQLSARTPIQAYMLEAELSRLGVESSQVEATSGSVEQFAQTLAASAQENGFVIVCGGVSFESDDDFVQALHQLNADIHLQGVAVEPGAPFTYAQYQGVPIMGLPHHAIAAMTAYHILVKPALRRVMGKTEWRNPTGFARSGALLHNPEKRSSFVRARLTHSPTGMPIAFPTGQQNSTMLTSLLNADCFIVIPPDIGTLEEFGETEFMPITRS